LRASPGSDPEEIENGRHSGARQIGDGEREQGPGQEEIAEITADVVGLRDKRDRGPDREGEKGAGALAPGRAVGPAPKSEAREPLRQDERREGKRRARRAAEIVPIMGEQQNDPAADEHCAEDAEKGRRLKPATFVQFAVTRAQLLRGLARERSVAHEAGELIIEPGDLFAVAHLFFGARPARRSAGYASPSPSLRTCA
jgi:hypothetical protein